MSIVVSILTGGSHNHSTSSEEVNALATDFVSQGVVGTLTNTSGVAPATGGFAVNAQGTPDATVAVSAGTAYVAGTPTSQNSQTLRIKNSATSNVTISANSTGSTKYDWIYISISAANAANPNSAADNVATLTSSRSSSPTTDDGTPPAYGYALAVVTVANGFTTITNGNITDKRSQSFLGSTTVQLAAAATFDFIESGCVWSADSAGVNRNASMTAGYVWLSGVRLSVAAVTARTFTASKDTYVDFSNNGDGTAAITYTEATNNAASSALTAGSLRNAIIVTGATTIAAAASINQGQEDRVLPIASSIAYSVTDSLGNLICPRDPQRRVLGYRRILTDFTGTGGPSDVTGLNLVVNNPTGRKIKVSAGGSYMAQSSAAGVSMTLFIVDVTAGATIQDLPQTVTGTSYAANANFNAEHTPSAGGSRNYKVQYTAGSNTFKLGASSTSPGYIRVELA